MVIYYSILVYVFAVGAFGKRAITKFNLKQKYDNKTTLFFAVLILAMPIFFIGMRTAFEDTQAYMNAYKMLSYSFSDISLIFKTEKGPVWILYQLILKKLGFDSGAFIMITAVISALGLFRFYYKYSNDYTLSIFLFFLSCNFTWMMNGARQFFAIGIIAFFSDFIFEKKTFKFILLIVFCYYIHNTSIIWIPVYFIIRGKPWSPKIIFAICVSALIALFAENFTDFLNSALEDSSFSNYTDAISKGSGSNIISTIVFSVPLIISIWKKNIIEEKAPEYIKMMINISAMAVAVSIIANFTSGLLIGRLPIYFLTFNYALLPWILENCFNQKDKKIVNFFCYLFYFFYFLYYCNFSRNGLEYVSSTLGLNL